MYRTLLVALDGSSHSNAALEQAYLLASRSGACVLGVHVLDDSMLRGPLLQDFSGAVGLEPQLHLTGQLETYLRERAEALIQAFESRCAEAGVRFRSGIVKGDVATALSDAAELADLVLVGRRGASFDINPRQGGRGTVGRLMRHSTTSLLVAGPESRTYTRAVVAFDGSHGATRALKDAARFALETGIELVVCYVADPDSERLNRPLFDAEHYLRPFQLNVRFLSLDLRADDVSPGGGTELELGSVRMSLARNAVARVLMACVEREQAELLFVGYQGSSRLREWVLGHTPDALVRELKGHIWIAR